LRRSLSGLGDLNEHQKRALELLTTSIAEKIIHDPILTLKQKADRPSRDQILDFTRRLFRLDDNHDL
jgi:glutamyl-tRNA reductase